MAKEGILIDASRRFEDKQIVNGLFSVEDDLEFQAESERMKTILKKEIKAP